MRAATATVVAAAALLTGWTGALAADNVEREIVFEAEDGVAVHGVVAYPADAWEAGRASPVAVLLHSFGLERDTLIPLADALNESGLATVRIDLRGHGKSRVRDGTSLYVYPAVPYDDFIRAADDVRGIIEMLARDERLDASRLTLVGVAEGALVAAETAARAPSVRGLVVVDPSASALGFDPERALAIFGARPVLLVASAQPISLARAEALAEYGLGERTIERLESFDARHRLVGEGKEAPGVIAEWLTRALAPEAR